MSIFKRKVAVAIYLIIVFCGICIGLHKIHINSMAKQIKEGLYNKHISKYVSSNYYKENIYTIFENNILGNSSAKLYSYGKYVESPEYIFYVNAYSKKNEIVRYNKKTRKNHTIIDSYAQNLCIRDDLLFYINLDNRYIYSSDINGHDTKIVLDKGVRAFQLVGEDILALDEAGTTIYYIGRDDKIELTSEIDFFSVIGNKLIYVNNNTLISYDMESKSEKLIYPDCISAMVYDGYFVCETSRGIERIDYKGNSNLLVDGDAYILGINFEELFYNKADKILSLNLDGEVKELDTYKGYIRNFIVLDNKIKYDQVTYDGVKAKIEHKKIILDKN